MASYFRDNAHLLSIKPLLNVNSGFRPGQLGALHSVLAHVSVNDEPSTVVLPTGYGKTAVLMALPFIMAAERVLVVEPSDALRKQTTGHFKALSTLKKIQALEPDAALPKVIGQKGRPATKAEWDILRECDVVVSTPLSTSPAVTAGVPADLFDLIIFDEAHHAPADTWSAYLSHYKDARFIFLTATPFRRDGKVIPGKIAYVYPVSRASKEKAFGKVHFRAAQVSNDQDDEEIDRAVARVAANQLREDRAAGYDHRLFARAASIKSARLLVDLYTAEGLKVKAIDSYISNRAQDQAESDLIAGTLDGVVCVDMFGEGYDFPKLKVAALHAPHASLVPTLQFIGRFARTTDSATGDATLIAPLNRVKEATIKLFKDGVDIGQFIDEAAQAKIATSERQQEILEILKPRQQAESDYEAVSPLSLELFAHTRIFACEQAPDFSLIGATVGRKLRKVKQWTTDNGIITLLLTLDQSPPDWATSDVLVNVRHDAFLLAYNEATGLCYVGSTRRTERIYLELLQSVCKDRHRPLSYDQTRRAIAGLGNLRFYNVGLKNTAINSQAESYRVLTGPRAERAVTAGDARAYVQGHFFGSGESGDERETVGASSSSRIWSNRRLDIGEYIDWVTKLNRRLSSTLSIADSQLDIIQHAKVMTELPRTILCAGWNKAAYRNAPSVRYRHGDHASFKKKSITDFELANFRVAADQRELTFDVVAEDASIPFTYRCSGGLLFALADPAWTIEVLSRIEDWTDLATWMSSNPPVFYAADKSSFQGVNLMKAPAVRTMVLHPEAAKTLDWRACAIGVEFDVGKANGRATVHQHLETTLLNDPELKALIYDHRTGEAADYISVSVNAANACTVRLYHCKGAGGLPSGERVGDVYEVAGQMLKSIAYCEPFVLIEHVKNRLNAGRHKTPSRFVSGDFAEFERLLLTTPANLLMFEIYGVQPGISKSKVDEHLSDLMTFGLDFAQRGGAAKAGWIVNI